MPKIRLIEQPVTVHNRNVLNRLRQLILRLVTQCAGLSGCKFTGTANEEQPITALPALVEESDGCLTIRVMALAQGSNVYILAEPHRVAIEAWVREENHYCSSAIWERIHRRFARIFELPWAIDAEGVRAELQGCVLTIKAQRAA